MREVRDDNYQIDKVSYTKSENANFDNINSRDRDHEINPPGRMGQSQFSSKSYQNQTERNPMIGNLT